MRKASVARDLLEKNGVDVDQLLGMLMRAALGELGNYYHYTLLRLNLLGGEGEGLRKIVESMRQEDLTHFEALVPRIHELGGVLPKSITWHGDSPESPLGAMPDDLNDTRGVLDALIKSADRAVRDYTAICNFTCSKDNRTYGLALAILHEKIEHHVLCLEFLGHGQNALREQRALSPFVSKYLHATSAETEVGRRLSG